MSKQRFKKVCVLGAGVMGSGIAAQVANAGIPVLLLDIKDFAKTGLQKALKLKPAPFFSAKHAGLIETGNLETDLARVKECDLVIEAIIENIDVKRDLYSKLEPLVGPETIVASNSSGLSLKAMTEGRSSEFKSRFLLTHFFNPVRYLPLLEIVTLPETTPEVVERVTSFGENVLGKGIVYGKDTPNFVANRIGMFGMMETLRLMGEGGYTPVEVDAVFGPAMGRPKSALFRTMDVVGLDTFIHVAENYLDGFEVPDYLRKMVANGWLGQKSGQGFYKKEGKEILALDLQDMTYKPKAKVRFDSLGGVRNLGSAGEKIKHMVNSDDRAGQLAWKLTSALCIYSANRLGEIADDIVQMDNALKWGFGFAQGPFETWDSLGVEASAKRMTAEGLKVPTWVSDMLAKGRKSFYAVENGHKTYWDPKAGAAKPVVSQKLSLTILKEDKTKIVRDTMATSLVDLGDGVLAVEFHTKMNAIDNEVLNDINTAIDLCEAGQFQALVLANEGQNFSVGANLLLMYMGAMQGQWDEIDKMIRLFQNTGVRLKYSSIPTVAAPFNMTFGGGTELSLWCNQICAHAELYMGLVEAGVGLIPGGGGNIEMLARTLKGAVDAPEFVAEPFIKRAFETVAMAKVSTSAHEAQNMLFLCGNSPIILNRQLQLECAKQSALGMAKGGFRPPMRRSFRLPGKSAYSTFDMVLRSFRDGHQISDHDLKIGQKIAHVMTGGDTNMRQMVSEQYLLDLEREAFLSLCAEEKTMARIAYMLENNKPLRN
ncbi:MAG: 3-hydroxyacyl-CoA dehydrogenase/enoyl-CoA hydratase family protein [Myxococcota bacterium]